MGLGKTVTAIATAMAAGARRVVIVVPSNALSVWDREIRHWVPSPVIHRVDTSLDARPLPEGGWVIVTYDQLAVATESYCPPSADVADELRRALRKAGHYKDLLRTLSRNESDPVIMSVAKLARMDGALQEDGRLAPFTFSKRTSPGIAGRLSALVLRDAAETGKLHRAARRLGDELGQRLRAWQADFVIVDEVHRVKSLSAERSEALRRLTGERSGGLLLSTGTPLRNHAGEGAALVDTIHPGVIDEQMPARSQWSSRKANGSSQARIVGQILRRVMIRRSKELVVELPPKVRRLIEIEMTEGDWLGDYQTLIDRAFRHLSDSRLFEKDKSRSKQAREAFERGIGCLSKARHMLAIAKVEQGGVADLIKARVDERGQLIVFAHPLGCN